LLCACSRRTATSSYIQVAKEAFGKTGGYVTTVLLLTLTFFVIIAYMILVRDIWTGVVQFFAGGAEFTTAESNTVLVVSFEYNDDHPEAIAAAKMVADSWSDVLRAFPIMSLAYLCHASPSILVNILSVQAKLVNPTRDRLKGVIHGATGLGSILYTFLGLFGYFYAYDNTKDDILLNFDPQDGVILVGRLGLGVTMLCAVPMMVLPCRDALKDLARDLLHSFQECYGGNAGKGGNGGGNGGEAGGGPDGSRNVAGKLCRLLTFVVTTLCILGVCLYAAVSLPGVAVVWSICGSSVGFLVGYILPALFYLRIRRAKPMNARKAGAYLMLVVATAAMILCTQEAVSAAF
ncbi:unnamed protein product, partial [Phaeothamnion confervicola]